MVDKGSSLVKFLARPDAERRAITERVMAQKASLTERWLEPMDENPHPLWEKRAEVAAAHLYGAKGVADFGCGAMLLEQKLDPRTLYVPFDLTCRDRRTRIIDLNVAEPPGVPGVDAAVCLGLLEYVHDVERVISGLRRNYKKAVISYAAYEGGKVDGRRLHGWVNDFSASELEALFLRCGWAIIANDTVAKSHLLWCLR